MPGILTPCREKNIPLLAVDAYKWDITLFQEALPEQLIRKELGKNNIFYLKNKMYRKLIILKYIIEYYKICKIKGLIN